MSTFDKDITLLDANFAVYGDPIKAFESLAYSDAWEDHGTFSLVLSPDEFTNVIGAAWFVIDGRLYENETALSDDGDLNVKITGATPNVLFDRIIISQPERLQGRLEERARYLVYKYAIVGSQRVNNLVWGADHGYARAMDATTERGQTLSSFLYEQLGQRGFSYRIDCDVSTGQLSFDVLRGLDRTQDQTINIPVMLSTQDAIEKASYKKSIKDERNFAVVCDENEESPTTVEVDLSYGAPVKAFYVPATAVTRDPDATINTFVMVGAGGSIYTSVDGKAWTARTSGTAKNLWSVEYQNARFIAGGSDGEVCVSSDSVNWTKIATGSAAAIEGAGYLDGLYLALGNNGSVYYSYDTVTWLLILSTLGGKAVNAVIARNRFVLYAVGTTSVKKAYSEDGVTNWTLANVSVDESAGACVPLRTVFVNGKIIVSGYLRNVASTVFKPFVITSDDDGLTETVNIVESLTGHKFLDMAAGLGLLVACGQPDILAWSDDDGATWTECTPATAVDYITITFDGTSFYAYGFSTRKVAISTDGKNFTVYDITGVTQNPDAVAFCAESYLDSLRQIGVTEIRSRSIIESIDGDINADLAPVYKTDYNVGDTIDVDDKRRGIMATKRVLEVEHIVDKNNDFAIVPKLGRDFLSLRKFIEKRR